MSLLNTGQAIEKTAMPSKGSLHAFQSTSTTLGTLPGGSPDLIDSDADVLAEANEVLGSGTYNQGVIWLDGTDISPPDSCKILMPANLEHKSFDPSDVAEVAEVVDDHILLSVVPDFLKDVRLPGGLPITPVGISITALAFWLELVAWASKVGGPGWSLVHGPLPDVKAMPLKDTLSDPRAVMVVVVVLAVLMPRLVKVSAGHCPTRLK